MSKCYPSVCTRQQKMEQNNYLLKNQAWKRRRFHCVRPVLGPHRVLSRKIAIFYSSEKKPAIFSTHLFLGFFLGSFPSRVNKVKNEGGKGYFWRNSVKLFSLFLSFTTRGFVLKWLVLLMHLLVNCITLYSLALPEGVPYLPRRSKA